MELVKESLFFTSAFIYDFHSGSYHYHDFVRDAGPVQHPTYCMIGTKLIFTSSFTLPQNSTSWRSSLRLLLVILVCKWHASPGKDETGEKTNASPRDCTSLIFGGLKEPLKLPPLQDAVRREWGGRELWPFFIAPLLAMLPMLGTLCMVEDGVGDRNESLAMEAEVTPWVKTTSGTLSAILSIVFSPNAGVGMKNFALKEVAGLIDGTEGDWYIFAGLPPAELKVSTYLQISTLNMWNVAKSYRIRSTEALDFGVSDFY